MRALLSSRRLSWVEAALIGRFSHQHRLAPQSDRETANRKIKAEKSTASGASQMEEGNDSIFALEISFCFRIFEPLVYEKRGDVTFKCNEIPYPAGRWARSPRLICWARLAFVTALV